jgi:hypothetical protein
MDPRSEAALATVSPDLAAKVRMASAQLAAQGTFFSSSPVCGPPRSRMPCTHRAGPRPGTS